MVGGACWGFLGLYRARASPAFTPAEAALLARLAPHLAHGLRTALMRRAVTAPTLPDTPGVVLLDEDLAVVATTPAADRWLDGAGSTGVAARLCAAAGGVCRGGPPAGAWSTVARRRERCCRGCGCGRRAGSGWWCMPRGWPGLASRSQIAVIFEVARPVAIAPLIAQAYALSPREAEIVQWVAGGRSTAEIAAQLHIARSTVQDHLKAIFTKVGVHSRGELLGQLFAAHYQPRIAAGTPLDADGWFM